MFASASFALLCLPLFTHAQTYSATYLPSNAPKQTEQGQTGTNQCGTNNDQNSMCQNVYVNSVDDFCLFAPPQPGADSGIGNTERIEVSWCVKPGYGTRLIPDGAITGAHFVQTPDYVQVTGVGNLTSLNIPTGDEGGELDPHGADGNGNPIGGLVFSRHARMPLKPPHCASISMTKWAAHGTCLRIMILGHLSAARVILESLWAYTVHPLSIKGTLVHHLHTPRHHLQIVCTNLERVFGYSHRYRRLRYTFCHI
ncbi:hypothetical protein EW026_g1238 [Hermanssonia centrifuga]|uniref:Uncharacterized protein n=1 Tax=Hermanssonia centrifuga TaxID=98765 RepID=A0A4S4KTX3_9APHY|nr:hypothetical protein EW026_g1238 [Hermanssonia centrifuga]